VHSAHLFADKTIVAGGLKFESRFVVLQRFVEGGWLHPLLCMLGPYCSLWSQIVMLIVRAIFFLILIISQPVWADEPAIGFVKTVKGEASVITAGLTVKAVVGTPVRIGSLLKTGSNASMGVTFKDNTVMAFGPDTELVVDDFLYSPNKGKLRLNANLAKGSLAYLSGAIAKIMPDAVTIKTPTGTIGVRGTHFVVRVEPE
jgi:hypothetical protein